MLRKTVGLKDLQQTVINTLHKDDKSQKVIEIVANP